MDVTIMLELHELDIVIDALKEMDVRLAKKGLPESHHERDSIDTMLFYLKHQQETAKAEIYAALDE